MDFFSILQQNSNENKKEESKKKELIEKEKENLEEISHSNSYKNLRKGSYIKIIGVKNSNLNSYKGYIGEIRDYKKDQDFAMIFLHCIQHNNYIKFPIDHFIVID